MDPKGMIARYLGLTTSGELALADAIALVGLRHAVDPEMRKAAKMYSAWCALTSTRSSRPSSDTVRSGAQMANDSDGRSFAEIAWAISDSCEIFTTSSRSPRLSVDAGAH
jgi:hypothetical protein